MENYQDFYSTQAVYGYNPNANQSFYGSNPTANQANFSSNPNVNQPNFGSNPTVNQANLVPMLNRHRQSLLLIQSRALWIIFSLVSLRRT